MRFTEEFILPLILYFKFEVLIMQLVFCRASETLWPLKDKDLFSTNTLYRKIISNYFDFYFFTILEKQLNICVAHIIATTYCPHNKNFLLRVHNAEFYRFFKICIILVWIIDKQPFERALMIY